MGLRKKLVRLFARKYTNAAFNSSILAT